VRVRRGAVAEHVEDGSLPRAGDLDRNNK